MDWATFLTDNSASVFTLVGVFLGSAITFLISYLNNRFEAKERDKDRAEKRKEAKIQAREKWTERDVLRTMDEVEKIIMLRSKDTELRYRFERLRRNKELGAITIDDYRTALLAWWEEQNSAFHEVNRTIHAIVRLVSSFDDSEIEDGFKAFFNVLNEYLEKGNEEMNQELTEELIDSIKDDTATRWLEMGVAAGKFQYALREKLISLRDT